LARKVSYPPDRILRVPLLTTALHPVPLAPEISLYLADAQVGLFDAAGGDFRSDEPPPFWAFVWAGGQALARYVLDHRELVLGRTVWDLAAGSGVAAIAAAKAGARTVTATDLDLNAAEAIRRNAAANDIILTATVMDVADTGQAEVLLAGDVFYSPRVAERMTAFLRARAGDGARILVGDPARGYFPQRLFVQVAEYIVPVPAALEEAETLVTGVYEMRTT
jgi:predicted nicotinamide N-methyase